MFTERNYTSYKVRGELEQNGIAQLPPTEITESARNRLLAWGFNNSQITELRGFTSQFRYDRCLEKISRISQQQLSLIKNLDNTQDLKIPFYFDVKGRLDGQCGDIGRQYVFQANFSGLIQDINEEFSVLGSSLAIGFCYGRSATHFCKENDVHVWNSLVLKNRKGKVMDSIFIDAAFQKIMSKEESGYTLKEEIMEISDVSIQTHETIRLGEIYFEGSKWVLEGESDIVLGMSNDKKYAFSLGFAQHIHTRPLEGILSSIRRNNKYIPALSRIMPDGNCETYILYPNTENLGVRNELQELNTEEYKQIVQMLKISRNIQIIANSSDPFDDEDAQMYTIKY